MRVWVCGIRCVVCACVGVWDKVCACACVHVWVCGIRCVVCASVWVCGIKCVVCARVWLVALPFFLFIGLRVFM